MTRWHWRSLFAGLGLDFKFQSKVNCLVRMQQKQELSSKFTLMPKLYWNKSVSLEKAFIHISSKTVLIRKSTSQNEKDIGQQNTRPGTRKWNLHYLQTNKRTHTQSYQRLLPWNSVLQSKLGSKQESRDWVATL